MLSTEAATAYLATAPASTIAAVAELAIAIDKADSASPSGKMEIRATKRRQTITPANAFAICFTHSLADIIDKTGIGKPAIRLMLELVNLSQDGTLISVNQAGLAKRLGTTQPQISRTMKTLVAAGVILELDHGTFLNPQVLTKRGLDFVRDKYPAEVVAGIAALAKHGIAANWDAPKTAAA